MLVNLPLDSAARLLSWSNRTYVFGGVLTLASAAMVLYEKRSRNQGRALRWGLATEIVVIVAAFISLCGMVAAISFGNIVSHLKDNDLESYKMSAGVEIAHAKQAAAEANQKAQVAQDEEQKLAQKNLKLSTQVSSDAASARSAEVALAKANKDTSDFAHALAQQQQTMEQQAKVSPVLTNEEIASLARLLAPYRGQDVILHSTLDTTVLRLQRTIAEALQADGITFKQNSMDAGQLYQGVSVAVHSPQDVPPLASALVLGLRQAGIDVHPVSAPQQVPAGKVAIYLGPN